MENFFEHFSVYVMRLLLSKWQWYSIDWRWFSFSMWRRDIVWNDWVLGPQFTGFLHLYRERKCKITTHFGWQNLFGSLFFFCQAALNFVERMYDRCISYSFRILRINMYSLASFSLRCFVIVMVEIGIEMIFALQQVDMICQHYIDALYGRVPVDRSHQTI